MRNVVRGAVVLIVVSIILTVVHSCALDNHILKPSCVVFNYDLVEKWWEPGLENFPAVYFNLNNQVVFKGATDSLTYELYNCDKLRVTDHTNNAQHEWEIKVLTDKELQIKFPDTTITYVRKK